MKKQKSKAKRKTRKRGVNETVTHSSWVDDLSWMPVAIDDYQAHSDATSSSFSIVSWNVLADAYCSPRSHRCLPEKTQCHVFNRNQRQHHVQKTLRQLISSLNRPVLALQEVDAPLGILKTLQDLGYDGIETPTSAGGRNGRVDACGLYFNTEDWVSIKNEAIRLDDLASLRSKFSTQEEVTIGTRNNLQGLQSNFLRKNMALLVMLQNVQTKQTLAVAVLHLYWNPNYEYVKLCQAHYIMMKAKAFCNGDSSIPLVLCGDLNSQPESFVYKYLSLGTVNAKVVTPWYSTAGMIDHLKDEKPPETDEELLQRTLQKLTLTSNANCDCDSEMKPVQYLLDYTLNRFCRWLRILGIDSVLETEEEEKLRTKEGCLKIFDRCRRENRTLITTSTKLLLRKDCPQGAYLLDTKSLANLELSLIHLLLSHGVTLEPRTFLTRCVVCNGLIRKVSDEHQIKQIFEAHSAPETLHKEVFEVFQCSGCRQGYWWCEKPTSSASRVKTQAASLLEACIRGGVPLDEDMTMFDFVNAEEVKAKARAKEFCNNAKNGTQIGCTESNLLMERLDVVEWLQDEALTNPFGPMQSVYSGWSRSNMDAQSTAILHGEKLLQEEESRMLSFTNVTHDFVGHLDHIFVKLSDNPSSGESDDLLQLSHRLYVPTTYLELNPDGIRNGHLLPSKCWPSDHLAVGAKFGWRRGCDD